MDNNRNFDSYFTIRLKTTNGIFLVKLFVASSATKPDVYSQLWQHMPVNLRLYARVLVSF
jgi:hypothetical protein